MLTTLFSAMLTLFAAGQPAAAPTLPDGWHARADGDSGHAGHAAPAKAPAKSPAPNPLSFVDMPPGWHVTTGPSVILYQTTRTATGSFGVRSESFLFDPGTRREGYGIFIGGRGLDGPEQQYTYFLIRRSGEFLIKKRKGETISTLRDWTPHAAIVQYDKRGEGPTAKNVLGVEVDAKEVAFLINGTEVARLPRAEVDTDGIVGLRVNHQLNLHVSTLVVTPAR